VYAKEGVKSLWRPILHNFPSTKYYSKVGCEGGGNDGPCRQRRLAWDIRGKILGYGVRWDDGEEKVSEERHGKR
jgi:hypothetical protein